MKYTFTYGRNSQLIWAMILPAFVGLIPLMLVLELSKKYYQDADWIVILATFLYLALVVIVTFSWVKSIRSDVAICLEDNELNFNFIKKNLFHKRDFTLHLSNLRNTSEDNDKGFDFLYIETQKTSTPSFHLMAKEGDENFIEFKDLLYKAIDDYGETVSEKEGIRHITIYQKWHMKLLAFLCLVSWFIFPIALYYQETNWFMSAKYWVFVVLTLPIILKVYIQNFKK